MQHCQQCGHHSPNENIFCGQCGNRLNNRCGQCGYDNLMQQNFCGNCGRQLRTDHSLPPAAPATPQQPAQPQPTPLQHQAVQSPQEAPRQTFPQQRDNQPGSPSTDHEQGFPPTETVYYYDSAETQAQHPTSSAEPQTQGVNPSSPSTGFGLPCYAFLSVEFANWDQIIAAAGEKNPVEMERIRQEHCATLANYFQNNGGQVAQSKNGVVFAAFPQAQDLTHSLSHAIQVSLPILQEEFRFQNTLLRLRGGLALEQADFPNPMTSGLERSISQAGTLVVGEDAYHLIENQFPADSLGQVYVSDRAVHLYRIPKDWSLDQPEAPIAEEYPPPDSGDLSQQALHTLWDEPEIQHPETSPTAIASESLPDDITSPLSPYASDPIQQDTQPAPTEEVLWSDTPDRDTVFPSQGSSQTAHPMESSRWDEYPGAPSKNGADDTPLEWETGEPAHPTAQGGFPDWTSANSSSQASQSYAQAQWQAESPIPTSSLPNVAYQETGGIIQEPVSRSPISQNHMQQQAVPDFQQAQPTIHQSPNGQASFGEFEQNSTPSPQLFDRETEDALSALFPSPPPGLEITGHRTTSEEELRPTLAPAHHTPFPAVQDTRIESEIHPSESVPPPDPNDFLPVQYQPPILGSAQMPRTPNIRYGRAVDALSLELEGFLKASGVQQDRSRIISLCASDGLGKSNMIGLARAKVDPQNQRAIWLGGASSRMFLKKPVPLSLWLDLLYNLLMLCPEGHPRQEAEGRIGSFLNQVYDGQANPEDFAIAMSLLSVERPQPLSLGAGGLSPRARHFFSRLLYQLSTKSPVILILEDLMYADPSSLELLSEVLSDLGPAVPLCTILTQTPDFFPQGALEAAIHRKPFQELIPADLDESETMQFLDQGPVGGNLRDFPPTLVNALCRQSRGLPLWLEESLRLLYLREVITLDEDTQQFRIQAEFRPSDAILPEPLTTMIRERVECLYDSVQYVLLLAATLGERFPVTLLAALSQMSEAEFSQTVDLLSSQGFLFVENEQVGRFRHGILWHAIYEDIEPGLRVQMHQLISETLESDFNQGYSVSPAQVAYHSQAGNLPNRSLNYWHLSGTGAGILGSLSGMNQAMFHALELLQKNAKQPPARQELALRTAEMLGAFNLDTSPDMASTLLEWVYRHREPQGDNTRLIEILGFLSSSYERQGQFEASLNSLDMAIQRVDSQLYPIERASLQISRLDCLHSLGYYQEGRLLMERDIEPVLRQLTGEERGFAEVAFQARRVYGQILLAQCDRRGIAALEQAVHRAEQEDVGVAALSLKLAVAYSYLLEGRYSDCNQLAEMLLPQVESMPGADWFLAQWGLLAMHYHLQMEDWNNISQIVLTVVSKAEVVRDYPTMLLAQIYAGLATAQGNPDEGRQFMEMAINRAIEHRLAGVAIIGWRLLAELYLNHGQVLQARGLVEQALQMAKQENIQYEDGIIRLTLLYSQILLSVGELKQAGKILEPMWPLVVKANWQPLIAACAMHIGQLYQTLALNAKGEVAAKHQNRSVEFFRKSQGIWHSLGNSIQGSKLDAMVSSGMQISATLQKNLNGLL